MTLSFSSLRFRLLLLVLLALVPAFVLVIYNASEQRRLAAAQAQEDALRLARVTANSHGELVESARQFLTILAQLPAIQNRDRVACPALLASLLKQNPHYLQLGVIERDGWVSCTAIPDRQPVNVADDAFFRRAYVSRDFAVGEYRIGIISGRAAVAFGYPLLDEMSEVQGVVFASLDLGSLNQLAAQVLLPPGSTITLRDRNGTILVRYPEPEKWVGQVRAEAPIAMIISTQQGEGVVEAIGVDDIPRLYAFTPLLGVPDRDIIASVGIPTAVAFAEVNQALARNLVALGLVTVLTLMAAWVGAEFFILRRVNALLQATKRLVVGDLSARTGLGYESGELGQLAHAFDQMVVALEERDAERRQAEEQIRRWNARLEGLINTIAEAISQPREVSQIADIALDRTLSVMDLAAGCVFLERGDNFVLVAHRGLPETAVRRTQTLRAGEKATGEIARLVHSAVVQKIPEETLPSLFETNGEGFRVWASVPIKSRNRGLGIMCLASKHHQWLEPHEQGVLAVVGLQIGVAVENAELYAQVQSIATLKERERLSRELHDGLAQVLGYLCIRSKAALDLVASGEAERIEVQLQEMQRATQEAYQDVRESILGLRTSVSPNRGLVSALKEYAHTFSLQTGIRANLIMGGSDPIECTPEAEVQLLRIIQETLSNVRRHSGAKQAWIRFETQAESTIVTIEDDGNGFDPASVSLDGQQHFGLLTMRERAESVGGRLQVLSQPGQGTKVVIMLPFSQGRN